ncbi:hypothetical protein GCM10027598_36380 [Amycolatopsis oliviviridis]|uniref:DUF4190 domain-containing protein n=1 Tax=Amycolatopsis oliviviridis TaxID=1471590 RepID=A0ABQ3LDQ2_9PSEU|nr:DUF4190 domain-containing protein [Amycolatopsis oliviviridis]GHH13108.1 hypothetical protein GCM10017790_25450 [Amycolatopsis oliviviridis]
MTTPSPYPYQAAPVTTPPRNGLGTAGFVLGLVGLLFSPIPFIGVIAWPLVIVGLVLAGIGYSRAKSGVATNKGLALTGVILSAVGLVICILWTVVFSKAVVDAANSLPTAPPSAPGAPLGNDAGTQAGAPAQEPAKDQAAEHTVVYRVTGTGGAKAGSITYTTDGMTTTNQEANVKLPWEKTIKLPGGEALQMVSIMAQGSGKGAIKVTIEVDGKLIKEASAEEYGIAHANENIGSLGN